MISFYNNCSDAGPDISAYAVFMDGCNLCCPYCMNSQLIKKREDVETNILERLKKDVDKDKPELIFISGGEPTLNPLALLTISTLFKSWGCKVGMSTNGTLPHTVEELVCRYKKIDYVALDLKGGVEEYKQLGSVDYYFNVLTSWMVLRKEKEERKNFDYEIRTTLYPPFINTETIKSLSKLFKPDEKWVLQQFRKTSDMPNQNVKKIKIPSEKLLKEMLDEAKKSVPNTQMRYV